MRRAIMALSITLIAFSQPGTDARAANAFAIPAFQSQWQQGEALVPNFWGPLATAKEGQNEPYKEGSLDFSESGPTNPGQGMRLVQYFDKGRMELTHPASGLVTNGLLATDLVKGRVQIGDATFRAMPPPVLPIAGDPDNPGPTYAGLADKGASLFIPATAKPGSFVTLIAAADGAVTDGGGFAGISMTPAISGFDATTQHNVLGVFADYRTRVGLLTIGYAISEPFRANVKVAGTPVTVLVQVFERRVLTYTASNPDPFKVEMGNIGQHYHTWLYSAAASTEAPPATAPPPPSTVDTGIVFTRVTSSVAAGATAMVTVQTFAEASCSITVTYKTGPATAVGLNDKTADASGVVAWTWVVATNTAPGNWPIDVNCTSGASTAIRRATFTVT